jgi:hypothetical protein
MEQSVFSGPVVNPANELESYPTANRQMFHNETKCVLVSRVASRTEIIFIVARTLTGNGGRPLQALQEIGRDSEATEATNPIPGFWQWFARFSPPLKPRLADNFHTAPA